MGVIITVTTRKMMVRAVSRMDRAISLGVFWRSAPSTRLIILSRKLWPGSAEMRTLIQSDSTLVPPVTELKSPPDSRMTGADSPVMADSSTLAMPSTTSPSPGMMSPASTSTRSPLRSSPADTPWTLPSSSRTLAVVSTRVRRRVSAWARPRPSASASAKLAKSTVNQSHRETSPVKNSGPIAGEEVLEEVVGGHHGADLHHEHHRVAHQLERVEP